MLLYARRYAGLRGYTRERVNMVLTLCGGQSEKEIMLTGWGAKGHDRALLRVLWEHWPGTVKSGWGARGGFWEQEALEQTLKPK